MLAYRENIIHCVVWPVCAVAIGLATLIVAALLTDLVEHVGCYPDPALPFRCALTGETKFLVYLCFFAAIAFASILAVRGALAMIRRRRGCVRQPTRAR